MPYYSVHVSASGRRSLRWSEPCDSPSQARKIGRARIDSGDATLSFVVEMSDRGKLVLGSYTLPPAARKVVDHYEALLEALED